MDYSALLTYTFGANVPRADFEELIEKKGWKNHPDESTWYKPYSTIFDNNLHDKVVEIKKYIKAWYNNLHQYQRDDVDVISLHFADLRKGYDKEYHPCIRRIDIVNNRPES